MAVFFLAEVSLFWFDQSVVTLIFLERSISYTTLPSLLFSTNIILPVSYFLAALGVHIYISVMA